MDTALHRTVRFVPVAEKGLSFQAKVFTENNEKSLDTRLRSTSHLQTTRLKRVKMFFFALLGLNCLTSTYQSFTRG